MEAWRKGHDAQGPAHKPLMQQLFGAPSAWGLWGVRGTQWRAMERNEVEDLCLQATETDFV